jgi:hypothetical protein
MTRGFGVLAWALAILVLAGCSADSDTQPRQRDDTSPQSRPVVAPGTTVATGTFSSSGESAGPVSGSVSIGPSEEGVFELTIRDLVVQDGSAVQFTLTADSLAPGEVCLDSDWRFGVGRSEPGQDPGTPLLLPIGGSDGIGQGDLSFIREVVVTDAPDGSTPDPDCPIPIVAHASLTWNLPDMRPGLAVADAGPATGAQGLTAVVDGEPVSYTVAQGDTLAAIAERFGLELDDLFYLNPRRSPNPEDSHAFTGEVLNLSSETR